MDNRPLCLCNDSGTTGDNSTNMSTEVVLATKPPSLPDGGGNMADVVSLHSQDGDSEELLTLHRRESTVSPTADDGNAIDFYDDHYAYQVSNALVATHSR